MRTSVIKTAVLGLTVASTSLSTFTKLLSRGLKIRPLNGMSTLPTCKRSTKWCVAVNSMWPR